MLHGMTSPTHPSGRRGQLATREMQEYSTLLEEALQGGRVSLEVGHGEGIESSLTCLVLPRQWAAFMKRVCDSFTKVFTAMFPPFTLPPFPFLHICIIVVCLYIMTTAIVACFLIKHLDSAFGLHMMIIIWTALQIY